MSSAGCLKTGPQYTNSLNEHQSIVEAILDGDSTKAEQHLREHILIQGERLTDFIASWDTDKVA